MGGTCAHEGELVPMKDKNGFLDQTGRNYTTKKAGKSSVGELVPMKANLCP